MIRPEIAIDPGWSALAKTRSTVEGSSPIWLLMSLYPYGELGPGVSFSDQDLWVECDFSRGLLHASLGERYLARVNGCHILREALRTQCPFCDNIETRCAQPEYGIEST